MKKRTLFFLCFISIVINQACYAQSQANIDSLLRVLKTAKEDTNKIHLLNNVGFKFIQLNPDTSILLSNQALKLAEKKQFKDGIAESHFYLGVFNFMKGDYILALENYNKALALWKELKDKAGEALVLGSMASVFSYQGSYPKALEYYFKSLKILEELRDTTKIGAFLSNIGTTYDAMDDYSQSLKYHFKALKILEEQGNKNEIAPVLSNIAIEYNKQGYNSRALDYSLRALKINEETGNQKWKSDNLYNIGMVYSDQGDSALAKGNKTFAFTDKYPKALDYYFRSLKLREESGDKRGIGNALAAIGTLYCKTGKFKEAEDYLKRANDMAADIGVLSDLRYVEEEISQLYDTTGRFKMALEHYKKAVVIKDSLFSQEKNNEITRKEMNYEFEKKEEVAKAEQDKKDVVTQGEIQKQKLLKNSFIGGLGMVIVLILFGYRAYRARQILRLQDIRNKISGDLHDDIGSTLNSISIYSEVAKKKDEQQDEALEMIGEASRKIIDAMSDIVWTINPDNDSFAKIIFRMKSLAYNLFRAKKIEFTFHSDEILDEKKLSLEERRNFYLIFKEAVNNLVKYSNATQVAITLTNENDHIRLLIRDNGIGFDTSQDTIGNGLKNMKRRADEMKAQFKIVSSKGNGTQIELILKA